MSTISSLTELTASGFAAGDNLPVDDISTTTTKRVEAQNLLDAILRVADAGDVLMLDATAGKLVVRQRGGTAGTDEVQISHDGTNTTIINKQSGGAIFLQASDNGAGGRVADQQSSYWSLDQGVLTFRTYASGSFGFSSTNGAEGTIDARFTRRAAGEIEVLDGTTGRRDLAARTLIARQDGGVVGTDEVQVSHDGTDGTVKSMSGALILNAVSGVISLQDNGVAKLFYNGSVWYFVTPATFSAGLTLSALNDAGITSPSASVTRSTNGSTGVGFHLSGTLVEANTAGSGSPNILTASESRTALTNEGATAENYHTLPTAAAGLDFEFVCQDSDGIRVTANTGDTIRDVGTVSATAGYIRSSTIGSVIRLKAINNAEWFVVAKTGTWTIDS